MTSAGATPSQHGSAAGAALLGVGGASECARALTADDALRLLHHLLLRSALVATDAGAPAEVAQQAALPSAALIDGVMLLQGVHAWRRPHKNCAWSR